MPLALFCVLEALFIYDIKLFSYNIGMDTELMLGHGFTNWLAIGRWGLVLLKKLLYIDICRENFIAVLFLVLTALEWMHFMQFFSGGRFSKGALLAFAAAYIAHGVWVDQFYFSLQSGEVSFALFFIPALCVLIVDSLWQKKPAGIAISVFAVAFLCAVYQSIAVFIGGGLVAALALSSRRRGVSFLKCLLCAALLFAGVALYALLSKAIGGILGLDANSASYLTEKLKFGRGWLLNFIEYCYMLGFANNPLFSRIFDGFMAGVAKSGAQAVAEMHCQAYTLSNTLFYPAALLYIALVLQRKMEGGGIAKLLFCLVPLSVLLLPAALGGRCSNRAQFILPFATAFMYLMIADMLGKKLSAAFIVVSLAFSYIQAQRSSTILYSDFLRFESDYALAKDIWRDLRASGYEGQGTLLYGRYSPTYQMDFVKGEDIGKSLFRADFRRDKLTDVTWRGVGFMRAVGCNVNSVSGDDPRLAAVCEHAKSMPSYPNEGYAQEFDGIMIVKLSDD